MNIGFVSPSSPEPVGGVIVLFELANALARRGHKVHIGHASPWGAQVAGLHEMPWITFEPSIVHYFAAEPTVHASEVIADVVFGAGPATENDALPAGLIQGFDMLGPATEIEWYRSPGLKVCVASWLVDAARYMGTGDQCVIMSPGVPLDTFGIHQPIADRPPTVVMLAHTHPAKGTTLGLQALERVHEAQPDVQIVLFSANPISRPLPPWIEQVLRPDHQRLSELFNQSSVFLQPSAYEGFGLTAIEAMASGCALVTTENGGSRDYAFHGSTALVTDQDADELAAATVRLLGDHDQRIRLADAGHRFVQRFTWDESARVLEGHLAAYLADPAPFLEPPGPNRFEGMQANGSWAATVLRETAEERGALPDHGSPEVRITPISSSAQPAMVEPSEPPSSEPAVREHDVVFNMVWTGRVFDDLQLFTASMLAHSSARYRFVANACPPEQVRAMEDFATRFPDRIVSVDVVSTERMVRHGDALDAVMRVHHDGPLFAFIDPDIVARRPFLAPFLSELRTADAVTSGREVWSTHNVRPAEHPGVNGEYFFDQDGYVFGSPHFSIYRRSAVDEVQERWGVSFATDGNVSPEVRARLVELGRSFMVYDTAKVLNILLQGDGHRLVHRESPDLVHIGGMSHYLAPPQPVVGPDGTLVREWGHEANWRKWDGMADRWDIAEYASDVLRAAAVGKEPPEPDTVESHLSDRARTVHETLTELARLVGIDPSGGGAP